MTEREKKSPKQVANRELLNSIRELRVTLQLLEELTTELKDKSEAFSASKATKPSIFESDNNIITETKSNTNKLTVLH